MKYVRYNRRILFNGFPQTQSFPLLHLPGATASQDYDLETGAYSQDLQFSVAGLENTILAENLSRNEFRAVIQDWNGNTFILGLVNGLKLSSMQLTTGADKAELSGYSIAFKGNEAVVATTTGLSDFIPGNAGVLFLASSGSRASTPTKISTEII